MISVTYFPPISLFLSTVGQGRKEGKEERNVTEREERGGGGSFIRSKTVDEERFKDIILKLLSWLWDGGMCKYVLYIHTCNRIIIHAIVNRTLSNLYSPCTILCNLMYLVSINMSSRALNI